MQQYGKILLALGLMCLIIPAFSAGVKDYGDSCNVLNSAVQLFDTAINGDDRNYKGACDVDKGLVCVGTCTCVPGSRYEENIIQKVFGGGKCVSGAGTLTFSAAIFLAALPILRYFSS